MIRVCVGGESDSEKKRPQSPQMMTAGSYYEYSREKYEERGCKMGADSGSIRWPATSVHTSLCLFKLKCLFFSLFPYIAL